MDRILMLLLDRVDKLNSCCKMDKIRGRIHFEKGFFASEIV
jgi:hypothetical protein